MSSTSLLLKLQQLTGDLKPAKGTSIQELQTLQQNLAQEILRNPDFPIFGNRLHHAAARESDVASQSMDKFSELQGLLHRLEPADTQQPSPRVFKRESAFQNPLLGNSVPEWASGMAASKSMGPFLDENGFPVWFDFFEPVRMVQFYIKGGTRPVLLMRIFGANVARKSYRIEPGSVWISSDLLARTSLLSGYYTGLRVTGGSVELSENSEVDQDRILIHPAIDAVLHLDLNQNEVTASSEDAGFDATDAIINLPRTLRLQFNGFGSNLTADDASCTVFGCQTEFQFTNSPPIWLQQIGQVLIPYLTKTIGDSPDTFEVQSSKSKLCTVEGSAEIQSASGWLLPAAKVDPQQVGEAAGTGALCIALDKGTDAIWKGLKGGATHLIHPAIIAEPGMITVIDFFAENLPGKQKWVLWKNVPSKHHSDVTLSFSKSFPFIFVTASKGSETVSFFCGHRASFDRPVDANGSPMRVESTIALASIIQTGASFRVMLLDNDLLFDGNPNKPDALKRMSIILRNAFFSTSRPYSLFLAGDLKGDDQVTKGTIALMFGIYRYLPTLPDPYVASYTTSLREREAGEFGRFQIALAGFVEWPNQAVAPPGDEEVRVYFQFAAVNQSLLAPSVADPANRNFQNGVRTFNRNLTTALSTANEILPLLSIQSGTGRDVLKRTVDVNLIERMHRSPESREFRSAVNDLETNSMLGHIRNKTSQVAQTLQAVAQNMDRPTEEHFIATGGVTSESLISTSGGRGFARDAFMLLDVSSKVDQMGVSFGTSIRVENDERGAHLRAVAPELGTTSPSIPGWPLQIQNLDVVSTAQNLRAVTLPQISWEPIFNIPLEIEGSPDPLDLVTVTPGLLVYDNDGIPTRIFSESPLPVSITPNAVTRHFLRAFNDQDFPRQLHSIFTLPFALIAQATFNKKLNAPGTHVSFNRPRFDALRGGLQIKALAPPASSPNMSPFFLGRTEQLDNLKWSLFGAPITGSTLGNTVKTIFNNIFSSGPQSKVPLEKIEFSGYGASIFSNWLNGDATVADVSQTKFDVLVGRTGHEVVQVRSILYPFGVHVVRTITLMRSNNGYVFRSDSGWKAESDGFYDFDYMVRINGTPIAVNDPYEFHPGAVKGVTNVREIKDFPSGGKFTSSFKLNDPDLPPAIRNLTLAQWQKLFKVNSVNDSLDVEMQAVVFDADVHMDLVKSGGVEDATFGDFKVQSRKMLGYVQISPSFILPPAHTFAELLNFQNGSLGGPVDCIIDVANSKQPMRLARVDVNPALDNAGKNIFVSAARGSLILPPDGSWSVVKQQLDTGDVKPVEEGQGVPLIKPNGSNTFKIANPADVIQQGMSKLNFGVVQSTGTQKLLFDVPQFSLNVAKLISINTYFADAYKLLNSKSVFPNIANALALTAAEREVEVLGEGLMKMAERDIKLDNLLPPNYQYAFIDEPGILRVYAEYKNTGGASGNLKLGIDSAAPLTDKWKAALSNIRVIVDLGPLNQAMWVDGNFNASSGIKTKFDVPHLQFGPALQPVVDILQVLATLSGNDFDKGMDVGMSNSPESWEYKFNCAKEIPVIKFPSPTQLTINPNPPLKLEAGLKIGFYFNELLSIPTDVKQLVPACGAYVEFYGRLQVQCFTLAIASVYAVGQVNLGIVADSKAGVSLRMKFGFGAEIVVGLPVVANVSVLYMVEVLVGVSATSLEIGALLLFRGSAEILGGLVSICIQIEAGGSVKRTGDETNCIAQVSFSIDVTIIWVIDISFSDSWEESRQIA